MDEHTESWTPISCHADTGMTESKWKGQTNFRMNLNFQPNQHKDGISQQLVLYYHDKGSEVRLKEDQYI